MRGIQTINGHYASQLASPRYFPDNDGEAMCHTTMQFTWIGLLKYNAEAQYRETPNVFVASHHLIYPVEGDPWIRIAPDVLIAYGPKKSARGHYEVWERQGIFPQVIFEVASPYLYDDEMVSKFEFYQHYGAEEYYLIRQEAMSIEGWIRAENRLIEIPNMDGYKSPRLGWTFHCSKFEISIDGPTGQPLRNPGQLLFELEWTKNYCEAALERNVRLAAKLRELGIDPDAL